MKVQDKLTGNLLYSNDIIVTESWRADPERFVILTGEDRSAIAAEPPLDGAKRKTAKKAGE